MSISIIDIVGNKSGMDDYSSNLSNTLNSLGYKNKIFSNFNGSIQVFKSFLDKRYIKPLYYIIGYFMIFLKTKNLKENIQIYHIFNFSYKEYIYYKTAKFLGAKIISICHDPKPLRGTNKLFIANYILRNASNQIVVHNDYSSEVLTKLYACRNNIHVIPHGVSFNSREKEIDIFYNEGINIPSSKNILLFFGQLKEAKGLDLLLKAFNYLDDSFYLVIAGKDDLNLWSKYSKIVDESHSPRLIKLFRFIKDDERSFLINRSNLVVLPYKEIYQSGVLTTVIRFGKPILASNLRPNLFYSDYYQNIFFFESSDTNDLVNSINRFFYESSNYQEKEVRNNIEDLSWLSSAKKFANLISST
jgi:D-inositol-3-phosphate glycosyltransferase